MTAAMAMISGGKQTEHHRKSKVQKAPHVSSGQYFWQAKEYGSYKDCSKAHSMVAVKNPTSTLNGALRSTMLMVAHVKPEMP